jgi:hypothetical protein
MWCTPDELHVDDEHGAELGSWRGRAEVEVTLGEGSVGVLR